MQTPQANALPSRVIKTNIESQFEQTTLEIKPLPQEPPLLPKVLDTLKTMYSPQREFFIDSTLVQLQRLEPKLEIPPFVRSTVRATLQSCSLAITNAKKCSNEYVSGLNFEHFSSKTYYEHQIEQLENGVELYYDSDVAREKTDNTLKNTLIVLNRWKKSGMPSPIANVGTHIFSHAVMNEESSRAFSKVFMKKVLNKTLPIEQIDLPFLEEKLKPVGNYGSTVYHYKCENKSFYIRPFNLNDTSSVTTARRTLAVSIYNKALKLNTVPKSILISFNHLNYQYAVLSFPVSGEYFKNDTNLLDKLLDENLVANGLDLLTFEYAIGQNDLHLYNILYNNSSDSFTQL